ncbi:MAG: hypothetical protein ABI784_00630 [Ginsengibacter sp.]
MRDNYKTFRQHIPSLVILGFLISASLSSFAQLPQIQTSVDKKNILIGQQLHFTVTSSMPDNSYRLSWFAIPDSFSHFEIVTKEKIDSSQRNGNLVFSQTYLLTNFDSGLRVIPQLSLKFETLDGDSIFNMFTDSIPISVGYAAADSVLPFHDIKNILEVRSENPWWYWLVAGLILLIILLLIIFRKRIFRKKQKPEEVFSSKVSPFDEATQSLEAIKSKMENGEINVKQFHLGLSDIFKRYFSRINHKSVLYYTTDELLMELSSYPMLRNNLAPFANSLRMGDAVKFAKHIPDSYSNKDCIVQVSQMIAAIHQLKKNTESAV